MTDDPDKYASATRAPGFTPDLIRDWTTIWRSELSATATDRERAESWSRLLEIWSGVLPGGSVAADVAARPFHADGPTGRAAPQSPAGSAPADAASDAGPDIGMLLRRIDELERRLAERDIAPGGTPPG